MTQTGDAALLPRDELRRLFDLRSSYNALSGGGYTDDPFPKWHALRESGPVHEGTVHALTDYPGDWFFQGLPYPDRPHFSAFSFEACDAAFRDGDTFASHAAEESIDTTEPGVFNSILAMGGAQHRRYRALVQPSFVPAKAQWWIMNWIEQTVHALIDQFVDDGRAELNVDFAAAIPVLTITGSFGVSVEQALIFREFLTRDTARCFAILEPIIASRREHPEDDLISVLAEAEYTDEEGVSHRLTDAEILSFAALLLLAGSGTTWKQMGITLAAILERPDVVAAVQDDRAAVRQAIEESVRWNPTDPMFSRHVTRDTDFFGVHLPEGSVLHLCLGAANHDPSRWERPDEYDITRPPKPTLAFGNGPHVCLGMHVARAEMNVGISALFDRLPNLRLDPDAEPPGYIGFYERGATAIPVVFDWLEHEVNEPGYTAPDITLIGQDHIDRYRETDGEEGYLWNGATSLLLTTTGRKSGEARTSALIYAQDGDDYLVVASMGGAPQHPSWYLNLTANPDAEVQVKADHIPVTARTASDDEKPRLWKIVTEQWPNYDVYQTRTDRVIPLVVLSPR